MRHITFLRPMLREGFSADAMTPLASAAKALFRSCSGGG
jgi:hypothetical protein